MMMMMMMMLMNHEILHRPYLSHTTTITTTTTNTNTTTTADLVKSFLNHTLIYIYIYYLIYIDR